MTKLITLLIGFSLAFTAIAQAKPAPQENPKSKKSKPVQQQQVAPRQSKKPAEQRFVDVPPAANKPVNKPRGSGSLSDGRYQVTAREAPKTSKKLERTVKEPANQRYTDVPPEQAATQDEDSSRVKPNKFTVKPNKPVVQPNTRPEVQSNKLNKTVKTFQPRHRNFQARVNPSVASVRFNENFRIRNAENWRGNHYSAFRTYRPQWRDRTWWHSHHNHVRLIGGGWYYWSSGYWYPAWGYDDSAAYYPYDGPIYVGSNPRPFDQVVADVQASLQEQGYYRGEVDGLVGPLTQEALAAYQSAQGLEPTAAIDQPTLESLGIS